MHKGNKTFVKFNPNSRWVRVVLPVTSVAVVGVTMIVLSRAATPTASIQPESGSLSGGATVVQDASASGGEYLKFGAATGTCNPVIDAKLVPSCGVWYGATANDHGPTGFRERIEEHESRIGRQVSFAHSYHQPGDTGLSTDDKYFINRPNTYLLTNWKPTNTWASGGGSSSSVNAQIDAFAASVKSVAPKKIMLMIAHEPENDVSGGAPGCSVAFVGDSGTPAEYRAMWRNVRNRFDAAGATNVVWAINYMSATKWNCMKKDLWPGNDIIDWVVFNKYPGNGYTWVSGFSEFYNWLTTNSDTDHDFVSKPWGIGEWGAWQTNQADVYKMYDDGRQAIANGTLPKIKLYTVFDSIGVDDSRVDYDDASVHDPQEQVKYNNFVTSPGFIKQ